MLLVVPDQIVSVMGHLDDDHYRTRAIGISRGAICRSSVLCCLRYQLVAPLPKFLTFCPLAGQVEICTGCRVVSAVTAVEIAVPYSVHSEHGLNGCDASEQYFVYRTPTRKADDVQRMVPEYAALEHVANPRYRSLFHGVI